MILKNFNEPPYLFIFELTPNIFSILRKKVLVFLFFEKISHKL